MRQRSVGHPGGAAILFQLALQLTFQSTNPVSTLSVSGCSQQYCAIGHRMLGIMGGYIYIELFMGFFARWDTSVHSSVTFVHSIFALFSGFVQLPLRM